jgi:hypothetical protein
MNIDSIRKALADLEKAREEIVIAPLSCGYHITTAINTIREALELNRPRVAEDVQ